jgi:hypothetical protein
MSLPTSPPYVGQKYQPSFIAVDNNFLTEVQSITLNRVDGGETVKTIMRGWAGIVTGAAMTTGTMKGAVPYQPTDVTGPGFANQGMITGKGYQLDATMLTQMNQNGNTPLTFLIAIGQPAAQQLVFKGFIRSVDMDYTVGGQINFSCNFEGNFTLSQ